MIQNVNLSTTPAAICLKNNTYFLVIFYMNQFAVFSLQLTYKLCVVEKFSVSDVPEISIFLIENNC